MQPPPESPSHRLAKTNDRRRQARQRTRVLPADHARLLMQQSELLVRRELRRRLQRFDEIADTVLKREEILLDRIENRPADARFSTEINNTIRARTNNTTGTTQLPPNAPIRSIYERLARLEQQILMNYLDARAAELALRRGQSYPDVRALLKPDTMRMPAFGDLVARELNTAVPRLEIRTIDDLNAYRRVLESTSRESGLAEARLLSLLRQAGPRPPGDGTGSGQRGLAMSLGPGAGNGYGAALQGRLASEASKDTYSPTIDPQMVEAQALPGRRFSRNTPRRGWLYINTWYMIGPWYNFGRNDFAVIHPPELRIDFDAVYTDGQRGIGIEERDAHPIEVRGDRVRLDGALRWKFMQSESIHNVPPVTIDWSTYYAYTELYFDEPAVMYVAVGTDDSGKVWINGEEIWHDRGMSWYKIDEHVQLFRFNQGVNRVLLRLENDGGGATGFSFLICPPKAITLTEKK